MHHFPKKPTDAELEYLLRYTYDIQAGRVFFDGREIGYCGNHGYMIISGKPTGVGRNRKKHLRSHVIWWIAKGKWPELLIDHDNGRTTDDRIENLLEKTVRGNNANSPRLRAGGLPTGVSRTKSGLRYEARIGINGRMKYLGTFGTSSEAGQAYIDALEANQRPKA